MNNKGQHPLAVVAAPWKAAPHRLISLWDMMKLFKASEICQWEDLLEEMIFELDRKLARSHNSTMDKKWMVKCLATLKGVFEGDCQNLEWEHPQQLLEGILMLLDYHIQTQRRLRAEVIKNELLEFHHAIHKELTSRTFTMVDPCKAEFFQQDNLFGKRVSRKFPSATLDVKEAGNCISADLNTSAIFHLMRVVEIGLRALARHLRVPIKKEQLEYLEWNQIIEQCEKKVKDRLVTLPRRTKRKSEALEFYHGVIGEFNAFKDVWRNNAMHSRGHYDEHQARSVHLHVGNFMRRLSTKVTEIK